MKLISIIIPVFNRPLEIEELLNSLIPQTISSVEIIVVEDGSTIDCKSVCERHSDVLYHVQNNGGPGVARNTGASLANGKYLLFLDSDCILPNDFIKNLLSELSLQEFDCWGGPDAAHTSFTPLQKAINYSMTSFLTTGGIRGSKKAADKFYPRSFNMGVNRDLFLSVGGFSSMRFGEDLDLSMRILEAGKKTTLLEKSFVFHKRRNNFKSFFKQVYNSGKARIHLNEKHKGSLKLVHLLPTLFTLCTVFGIAVAFFFPLLIIILLFPSYLFFLHALYLNNSLKVAALSVFASYTQLFGYGMGFIDSYIRIKIFKKTDQFSFLKTFYKN